MAAKVIAVSADDINYYTLPGSQGELGREAASAEDTTFGQSFRSNFPAIIGWNINANAVYKGFAGYQATVKKMGTATVMTAEACTLLSGKTFQITAAAKRIIDRSTAFTIYDNGVDHTADVLSIDPLFGKITFKAAYTVTGPVTITGKYFPTAALGSIRGFTLTQTAEAIDNTDYATAQANGGYRSHACGLRTVSVELPGVFAAANGLAALLEARSEVIIEINPDGLGATGSIARGFFRALNDRNSGNVGALEEENVTFGLSVPVSSSAISYDTPFAWSHGGSSPIPTAILTALNAWQNETLAYMKYLHDGATGYKGQGVITSMTLQSTLEGVNTFQVAMQGKGSLTAV